MLKLFHAQKNNINFYKIFSWEKLFIKSSYSEKKKTEEYTHPIFPTTPSHTTKKIIPWKIKKSPTFLFWKTTKLLYPMPPKKQPFELIPIPKNNHLSQSHTLKKILWKVLELSHLPFLTQKKPLLKQKNKNKNPNPSYLFLIASFM